MALASSIRTAFDSTHIQDSILAERHGNLRAKDAMMAKLHRGNKWFDSGEYFMSKEGKVPGDLLPGGAPVDTLPPKLVPGQPFPKAQPAPVTPELEQEQWSGRPNVSDY